MLTWVVGAGGLLGRAVSRCELARQSFDPAPVPWHDQAASQRTLGSDVERFADAAGDGEWSIVWAAGRGVVSTSDAALDGEVEVFEAFVRSLARRPPAGPGVFFLASSAGGVYAGSGRAPFREDTAPQPISPYGHAKLRQEHLAHAVLSGRVPTLVGRLTNLYGPGQDRTKRQGLISQLCVAAVTGQAIRLTVPMETLRDYLYEDDAGRLVDRFVRTWIPRRPSAPVIRNIASGRPASVAAVLHTVEQVSRRTIRVGLGSSYDARQQQRDLRVGTRYGTDVDGLAITPLPVGVRSVYDGVMRELQRASIGSG